MAAQSSGRSPCGAIVTSFGSNWRKPAKAALAWYGDRTYEPFDYHKPDVDETQFAQIDARRPGAPFQSTLGTADSS